MTAAVRNGSYDCQWIFDGMKAVGTSVAGVGKWSFKLIPDTAKTTISTKVQEILAVVGNRTPQQVFDFVNGFKRDVSLLFTPLSKESMDFGAQTTLEKEGITLETAIEEVRAAAQAQVLETRKCAQRVALVALVLFASNYISQYQ